METIVKEALKQSEVRKCDRSRWHRLMEAYWSACYRITLFVEKLDRKNTTQAKDILNFGCGLNLIAGAMNSDLWAPHRYLKSRQKPDIYWTGQSPLQGYLNHFRLIICEHVIEHLLPDSSLKLFKHLFDVLGETGVLLISYPDINKVLAEGHCQGYEAPIVAANSIIYRHGHNFMYDSELVVALLQDAGFNEVVNSASLPDKYKSYLVESREIESIYMIARK